MPGKGSFITRFKKLSAGERVAIIAGIFTIIAAVIQIMPALIVMVAPPHPVEGNTSVIPNIEISSVVPVLDLYKRVTDGSGNHADAPYIDLTLLNKGKGVAVVDRLELEIINASLNKTPVLTFNNLFGKYNNIFCLNIFNSGWGPAISLQYNASLNFGQNIDLLRIAEGHLNWTGNVNAGEGLSLNFKFNTLEDYYLSFSMGNDDLVCKGNISEQIRYKDIYNREFFKNFSESAFLYKINKSINKSINHTDLRTYGSNTELALAMMIPAVEILRADPVDPERNCPFNMSFNIHHYMSENQVDRIIITLNQTESSELQSRIKVHYNSENPVISRIISMDLITPNEDCWDNIRRIEIPVPVS